MYYRYAFQGMELDNEVCGIGNSYTTPLRQLDVRIGRWLITDPVVHHHQSPYSTFNNNPLKYIDPSGGKGEDWVRGGKGHADNTWHWEASVNSKKEANDIGANDWIGKSDNRTITASGGKKVNLSYDAFMDKGKVTWQNTTETPEAGISPFLWSQVNEFSWMGGAITNLNAGMNLLGNNFSRKSTGWGARSGWETVANLSSYVAYGSVAFATGGAMAPIFSGGGGVEMLNMSGKWAANTAKVYHNTFGKNGGYANAFGNFTSQTIANGGDLSKTNLLGVVTSGFIRNGNGVIMNGVLNGVASGGLVSYNVDGTYGSMLDNPYHGGLTTINGILLGPVLSPFGRTLETVGTGAYQGLLNLTKTKLD